MRESEGKSERAEKCFLRPLFFFFARSDYPSPHYISAPGSHRMYFSCLFQELSAGRTFTAQVYDTPFSSIMPQKSISQDYAVHCYLKFIEFVSHGLNALLVTSNECYTCFLQERLSR